MSAPLPRSGAGHHAVRAHDVNTHQTVHPYSSPHAHALSRWGYRVHHDEYAERLIRSLSDTSESGPAHWVPARVITIEREHYRVLFIDPEAERTDAGTQWVVGEFGETTAWAHVAGRILHQAQSSEALPAVGDWVLLRLTGDGATLWEVFPRDSRFARKAVGTTSRVQVVAANVDTVFVMSAVGAELNPRRLQRYVSLIVDGGAEPVLLVNKVDKRDRTGTLIQDIREVAPGCKLLALSAKSGDGTDAVRALLQLGQTFTLVGSSGVGKSTLLNALLGHEAQRTAVVRSADDKGRHTTTRRELFLLPNGALLMDTPGMREIGLLGAEQGVEAVFADVDAIAEDCRFSDCAHTGEPGCAVKAALDDGRLRATRFDAYLRLGKEASTQKKLEKERLSRAVRRGSKRGRAARPKRGNFDE